MDGAFASTFLESKIPCAPTYSEASQENIDVGWNARPGRHHVDAKICHLKQLIQTTMEERDRAWEECRKLRRELVLLICHSSRLRSGASESLVSTLQASTSPSPFSSANPNRYASHDLVDELDMFCTGNDFEWKPAIFRQDLEAFLYSEVNNKEPAINMEDYLELNNLIALEEDTGKRLPELVEGLQHHEGIISDVRSNRHSSTYRAPSPMLSATPQGQGITPGTAQPTMKSPHRSFISPCPEFSNMAGSLTGQGSPLQSSTSPSVMSSPLSPLLHPQSRLPSKGMQKAKDTKRAVYRTSSFPALHNRAKRAASRSRHSWLPIKPRIISSTSSGREWFMSAAGMQQPHVTSEPLESGTMVMLSSLPEKGKFLEAIMRAGPLLQNLLLAGPLPEWQCPPPTMDIPKVCMLSSDKAPALGDTQLPAA